MKSTARAHLLVDTLREPERAQACDIRDWEALVWQGRAAELLAQLHAALKGANVLDAAPPAARKHLELAGAVAVKHALAVKYELRELQEALEPLGVPVLLLKGAAYCALGHQASRGRLFNDVDILVPKSALPEAEKHLLWAGWLPANTNAYDERYYRQWMHEIPPLEHKHRATVLDVHHTILPPTSGIRPDPQDFFDAAVPLTGEYSFFSVLGRTDMVIHSACHLFFGEFHKGLRDLHDLHLLLSDFAADPKFWEELTGRAAHLGLLLPVRDALTQCRRLYRTAVPAATLQTLKQMQASPFPEALREWMFEHALRPAHDSAFGPTTSLAHRMLFLRSHWLRMPLPLLAYHLSHKALFAD